MMSYTEVLYISLPAFAANMAPVVAARVNLWKSIALPIDANRTLRGRPLLGKNKTWRGLLTAILAGSCVSGIQYIFSATLALPAVLAHSLVLTLLWGAYVGLLCMMGDMIGSALKRAVGIDSGRPFVPIDQIDYVFAFLIGTSYLIGWSLSSGLFLLTFAFFANLIANVLAYALGIKSTYW